MHIIDFSWPNTCTLLGQKFYCKSIDLALYIQYRPADYTTVLNLFTSNKEINWHEKYLALYNVS